jgi:tellurite resistance protein TerC
LTVYARLERLGDPVRSAHRRQPRRRRDVRSPREALIGRTTRGLTEDRRLTEALRTELLEGDVVARRLEMRLVVALGEGRAAVQRLEEPAAVVGRDVVNNTRSGFRDTLSASKGSTPTAHIVSTVVLTGHPVCAASLIGWRGNLRGMTPVTREGALSHVRSAVVRRRPMGWPGGRHRRPSGHRSVRRPRPRRRHEPADGHCRQPGLGRCVAGVLRRPVRLRDRSDASAYLAGYLVEKSLSLDNVFVFLLVFTAFGVPVAERHRLLTYGILGALVLRLIFILAGVAVLGAFSWLNFVFAAFLVWTGWRMFRHRHDHGGEQALIDKLSRRLPMSSAPPEGRLARREDGRRVLTTAGAALAAIAIVDLIFAVDSVPAILAITTDSFIVFAANAFALLGLRPLFFLVADLVERLYYLKTALAALLVFIGAKMALAQVVGKIGPEISLPIIAAILTAGVVASLVRDRRGTRREDGAREDDARDDDRHDERDDERDDEPHDAAATEPEAAVEHR